MKKLIFVLLLVVSGLFVFAQSSPNSVSLIKASGKIIKFENEIDYMRYSLNKSYKIKTIGYYMFAASAGVGIFTPITISTNEQKYGYAVAGALFLAATFEFVYANEWIRRSAIKPAKNGIGLCIEF